jgi:DNA invertase Pin-like site-specific DNA recombinase
MATHSGKYIAYYHVSTQKQGDSGLGLEAQQAAVRTYLNGGNWKLVAEFVEIESGKRTDRPKLEQALAACKKHGATLVIGKLDRLGRRASFISALIDSGVDFVAAGCPDDDRFMLRVRAAVAEDEARKISQRTNALAAAKARGAELGGWRPIRKDGSPRKPATLTEQARQLAAEARSAAATRQASDYIV